jgi:hypothetical protein
MSAVSPKVIGSKQKATPECPVRFSLGWLELSPGKTWENQPVRGGPDTVDKLRRHAERTARAGALDGGPLLGISVFAVLDMSLDDLLRRRFTSFRTIYLPTAGRLAEYEFELLPTGQRPHFTVRLRSADNPELDRLLAALGAPRANSQYGRGMIWREED